jgi:Rap1a immunity proteins
VVIEKTFVNDKTNQLVPAPFCIPDGVEHGQEIRIVLKYIRDNPAHAHKATAFLIVAALGKAFPCQGK